MRLMNETIPTTLLFSAFDQNDAFWNQANSMKSGGGQSQFKSSTIKQIGFPLPKLETRKSLIAKIEADQSLVASNRDLIKRFEGKIHTTIGCVWGEVER